MLCKCSLFLLDFFTNLLPFIKCCEYFTLLLVISSVLLASCFQFRSLCSCHKCIAIQIFIWIYELFKNDIFDNVALSNLENALQTNLRTGRTREYILKSVWRHKFWKFTHLAATMVVSSWVQCIYQSAQKSSGYITDCKVFIFDLFFYLCPVIVLEIFLL